MNDQMSTAGAGQELFMRGQYGPDEVVLEQRVAGSFFDFSLTLHDLRGPLCNNGKDHLELRSNR